jgi:hypothetical protein
MAGVSCFSVLARMKSLDTIGELDTIAQTTQGNASDLDGLINAALDIASRDAARRRELKEAIADDSLARALRAACALVDARPGSTISAVIVGQK